MAFIADHAHASPCPTGALRPSVRVAGGAEAAARSQPSEAVAAGARVAGLLAMGLLPFLFVASASAAEPLALPAATGAAYLAALSSARHGRQERRIHAVSLLCLVSASLCGVAGWDADRSGALPSLSLGPALGLVFAALPYCLAALRRTGVLRSWECGEVQPFPTPPVSEAEGESRPRPETPIREERPPSPPVRKGQGRSLAAAADLGRPVAAPSFPAGDRVLPARAGESGTFRQPKSGGGGAGQRRRADPRPAAAATGTTERCDAREALGFSLRLLRAEAEGAGVALLAPDDAPLPPLACRPETCRQLFLTILALAIRGGEPGSRIHTSLRELRGALLIRFAAEGWRCGATLEEALAAARRIAEDAGGSLMVEASSGGAGSGGAVVSLRLPLGAPRPGFPQRGSPNPDPFQARTR